MSKDKANDTIVDDHKRMLIVSKKLSDFQINNLKQWPLVIFPDILKTATVDYDFLNSRVGDADSKEIQLGDIHSGWIVYDFFFEEGTVFDKQQTKEKLDLLTFWVQFLFWKDTKVTFLLEGEKWKI